MERQASTQSKSQGVPLVTQSPSLYALLNDGNDTVTKTQNVAKRVGFQLNEGNTGALAVIGGVCAITSMGLCIALLAVLGKGANPKTLEILGSLALGFAAGSALIFGAAGKFGAPDAALALPNISDTDS